MTTRFLSALAVLAAMSVAGCGPHLGAVALKIEAYRGEAPLVIPDEVDQVVLSVTNLDKTKGYLDKSFDYCDQGGDEDRCKLNNRQFPLSLGIDQGDATPGQVRLVITLRKQSETVARTEAVVDFPDGDLRPMTVRVTVPQL